MANTYLVGAYHSQGSFTKKESGEVIDYNNVVLSILSDDQVMKGFRAFDVKIKYDYLKQITGLTFDELLKLLDSFVAQPSYRFYPVELIYVLDRSGKAKLSRVMIHTKG